MGFLRSRELDSGDDAPSNFTHYLYMRFANNGGNYHGRASEAKLQRAREEDDELRTALGAAYMRDCFRAQAVSGAYAKYWQTPDHILEVGDTQDLLQQDVFTFMQCSPKGTLLVHVDEHRSMCPDPELPERCSESTCRASWCPGRGPSRNLQKLADDRSHVCFQMWGQS